jgi:hypothetical protein
MMSKRKWLVATTLGLPLFFAAFGSVVCAARAAQPDEAPAHIAQAAVVIPGGQYVDAEVPSTSAEIKTIRTQQVQRSYAVTPNTTIELSNRLGDIHVTEGVPGEVSITAVKHLGVERTADGWSWQTLPESIASDTSDALEEVAIDVRQEDNRLRIETISNVEMIVPIGVDYEVRVPGGTALKLSAENGGVVIDDAHVDVSCRLSRGAFRASGLVGALDVYVASGNALLDNCRGEHAIETSRGSIRVVHASPFDAGEKLKCKTIDGPIEFETHDTNDFSLAVRRLGGIFDCTFPIVIEGGLSGGDILGRVGDGGAVVAIDTLDGPVRIRRAMNSE